MDKTGLLAYTNKVLDTTEKFICNSRPRRFGKSITAEMLTAYYSRGCDSKALLTSLKIAKAQDFQLHLNKYDVIHFDVQWCCISAGSSENLISYITNIVVSELRETYPEVNLEENSTIYGAMARINTALGKQFIVIIDEWEYSFIHLWHHLCKTSCPIPLCSSKIQCDCNHRCQLIIKCKA